MAVLPIVKYGDPILRKKAKPADPKDPSLKKLAQDMAETMAKARGVGLAGNQVGVLKQIAVVDLACVEKDGPVIVLLNPVLLDSKGEQEFEEGCLSFLPDIRGVVVRAAWCKLKAFDLEGREFKVEGQGTLAEALQHEMDHLNGVLFVDRMRMASRTLVQGKLKELRKQTKGGRVAAGKH